LQAENRIFINKNEKKYEGKVFIFDDGRRDGIRCKHADGM
jgi:hypothetical protein